MRGATFTVMFLVAAPSGVPSTKYYGRGYSGVDKETNEITGIVGFLGHCNSAGILCNWNPGAVGGNDIGDFGGKGSWVGALDGAMWNWNKATLINYGIC